MNKNGLALDELKIVSAYGKDNAQRFINDSEVIYLESNKKRVRKWEKRTRLQLPVGISYSNSNIIISDKSEDVNNNIQFRDRDYISAVERGDIPLSERFKTDNKDIRFQDRESISSEDELLANASAVRSALINRIKQNKTDAVSVFEPRL